jgi:hypothetical protein
MARGEDAQADRRQHGRGDQPSLAGKKDTVAKSPMQIIANGGRLNQPLQRRWMAAPLLSLKKSNSFCQNGGSQVTAGGY